MQSETITYEVDGITAIGHLAVPDGDDPRPGVLVCHEGPGIGDHATGRADRIASELGYVAFALDYNGDGATIDDFGAMMERIGELRDEPARIRSLGQAGLDVLTASDRVDTSRLAAIGYCFGGTMALELGRAGVDLKAIVAFHAVLETANPEDASNIRGKVLACIGADDPIIPTEQRNAFEAEMAAGGVDWQLHLLGAGAAHSFTNPDADKAGIPGIEYHAAADRRSWQAMLNLFDETIA